MKLRFTGKKQESTEVWSYFFMPEEHFSWIAGQSLRLELPRKTFGVSERRFTIASHPSEKLLQFTTRHSGSRFKTLLEDLQSGDTINAYGLEGDFVWQDKPTHKIFVAGGIGITPYRSLLQDLPIDVQIDLLYGTKDMPAVFEAELSAASTRYPGLKVSYVTDRYLSIEDIVAIEGWQEALIYLSGPSTMVETLYNQLVAAGKSKDMIKADLFTGNL